jgi:hypothetical protein
VQRFLSFSSQVQHFLPFASQVQHFLSFTSPVQHGLIASIYFEKQQAGKMFSENHQGYAASRPWWRS